MEAGRLLRNACDLLSTRRLVHPTLVRDKTQCRRRPTPVLTGTSRCRLVGKYFPISLGQYRRTFHMRPPVRLRFTALPIICEQNLQNHHKHRITEYRL